MIQTGRAVRAADRAAPQSTPRGAEALATAIQMKLDFGSYKDSNEFGVTLEPLDLSFTKTVRR